MAQLRITLRRWEAAIFRIHLDGLPKIPLQLRDPVRRSRCRGRCWLPARGGIHSPLGASRSAVQPHAVSLSRQTRFQRAPGNSQTPSNCFGRSGDPLSRWGLQRRAPSLRCLCASEPYQANGIRARIEGAGARVPGARAPGIPNGPGWLRPYLTSPSASPVAQLCRF
jgi:hypothetical protein